MTFRSTSDDARQPAAKLIHHDSKPGFAPAAVDYFAGTDANVAVCRLSDGISRIILRPNARITEADGLRTKEQLLALTGGAPGGVLLEITGVGSVSREAIGVYSGGGYGHGICHPWWHAGGPCHRPRSPWPAAAELPKRILHGLGPGPQLAKVPACPCDLRSAQATIVVPCA